jgi:hypothetical protein
MRAPAGVKIRRRTSGLPQRAVRIEYADFAGLANVAVDIADTLGRKYVPLCDAAAICAVATEEAAATDSIVFIAGKCPGGGLR